MRVALRLAQVSIFDIQRFKFRSPNSLLSVRSLPTIESGARYVGSNAPISPLPASRLSRSHLTLTPAPFLFWDSIQGVNGLPHGFGHMAYQAV